MPDGTAETSDRATRHGDGQRWGIPRSPVVTKFERERGHLAARGTHGAALACRAGGSRVAGDVVNGNCIRVWGAPLRLVYDGKLGYKGEAATIADAL